MGLLQDVNDGEMALSLLSFSIPFQMHLKHILQFLLTKEFISFTENFRTGCILKRTKFFCIRCEQLKAE